MRASDTPRIKKAIQQVIADGVDYILLTTETPEYVEVATKTKNKKTIYRVFDNGKVERKVA